MSPAIGLYKVVRSGERRSVGLSLSHCVLQVENYPEQHDILVTNLLAHFELDKLGNDMATHRVGDEGDGEPPSHEAALSNRPNRLSWFRVCSAARWVLTARCVHPAQTTSSSSKWRFKWRSRSATATR
jgi:hypothetical protein